jgi:hypothetical protein
MIHTFNRWVAAASTVTILFALSACAGGTNSPVPLAPGQNTSGFSQAAGSQERLTAVGTQPNATSCPSKFVGCYTFSLSKGLKLGWCFGPPSDRCAETKDVAWSGNVCLAKATKCSAIEQLKAKWTGPFKCTKTLCTSKGTYELDTITKGATPPKVTTQYAYKQLIHICSNGDCENSYIGISVSK